MQEALEFIKTWNNPEEYVECLTSGSTGEPGRILLPKSEMVNSARRTVSFFGLNEYSRIHSAISLNTIGGRMAWLRAKICKGKFSCEKPSNEPHFPDTDPNNRIALASVVPSQMISILRRIKDNEKGGHEFVDCYLIGGSPIPDGLQQEIAAAGIKAYETYGMTETASHIALREITTNTNDSWFKPLEGINVFDQEGCLGIEIEGWKTIVTNDEAEIREDGSFRIHGRRDNVIISGGKKIHPEKVEKQLYPFLGQNIMIQGRPDKKWGQKVVLVVEKTSSGMNTSEEIIALCKDILPAHEVPKDIIFDKLPRTPNGKLRRKL